MKFTKLPTNTYKNLQLNAGVLVTTFNVATGEIDGLVGATTGGINFVATPSFSDFGDDIDNCPKNTKELKKLDSWEATMSGTFVSVTPALAKKLVAVGDLDSEDETHIITRNDVEQSDFETLWWIGDYSDVNTGADAGFIAIKLINALSTAGFQIQSSDRAKGQFAFTYTGHYSIEDTDKVPFEIYIKEGSNDVPATAVTVSPSTASIEVNATTELTATLTPSDATSEIVWTISDLTKATFIKDGVPANTVTGATATVKGLATGTTAVVATANEHNSSCIVTVTSEGA